MERSTYHHGNLYQAIIEEAIKVIGETGVSSLNLKKISIALKVSQSAPFRHFSSKEDLLSKLLRYGYEKIKEAVLGLDLDEENPEESIKKIGLTYAQFAFENPALFTIMYKSESIRLNQNTDLSDLYYYPYRLLMHHIERGIKRNIFKGQAAFMGIALRSIVHGFISLYMDREITTLPLSNDPLKQVEHLIYTLLSTWKP